MVMTGALGLGHAIYRHSGTYPSAVRSQEREKRALRKESPTRRKSDAQGQILPYPPGPEGPQLGKGFRPTILLSAPSYRTAFSVPLQHIIESLEAGSRGEGPCSDLCS